MLCCSKQAELYLVFSLMKNTLMYSLILALICCSDDIINPKLLKVYSVTSIKEHRTENMGQELLFRTLFRETG